MAYRLERELFARGCIAHVIAAQTGGPLLLQLAQNMISAGLVTICPADFLYQVERERAQALVPAERFVDVDCPDAETGEAAIARILKELNERGLLPAQI